MEKILKLLPAGVEAEVYQLDSFDQAASYSAGVLKGVQSRAVGGYALRVIKDGNIGFATATTEDSIPWMVQAALDTAQLGMKTKLSLPTSKVDSLPVDEKLAELDANQLAQLAEQLQQKVRALNSDFMVQAGASLIKETTRVQNTAGGEGETSRVRLGLNCGAELVSGQDILNIWGGQSIGRLEDIDLDALVTTLFGPLMQADGRVVPVASGQQPVLLTGKAFSSIVIGPLMAAFSGRNVLQKTSPLIGKAGEKLFSDKLTMTDDATLPMAPSSASMDDEGVATRRFPLIENGVVKGFAYDLNTAAQAGVESTGHARKIGRTSGARLNAQPAPSFSNVMVEPGELEFSDLLKVVDNGVIVDQISGTPGFNPSGEFTVTIQLGYLVKNGQIAGRIKNAMLSGSAFAALNQILVIGKDALWNGGGETGALKAPAIVIDGLTVTAK